MIIAAALCPAPPLLVRPLTGAADVLPELRQACREAVAELIAAGPEVVAVVGAAEVTRVWEAGARFDSRRYASGSGEVVAQALPASLGLGDWLLSQAGYAGERLPQSVAADEPADRCAKIGAGLAGLPRRVALLVMADGSACRGPKAPGHFDERSAAFDAEVERAVAAGDHGALLAIDAGLASELMAAGRPAWQVLAGALNGSQMAGQIRYSGDPFGVAYLVASLQGKAKDG